MRLDTLPLKTDFDAGSGQLAVDGQKLAPNVRALGDMADVVADKQFLQAADAKALIYFMYRNIWRKEENQIFEGVGYDITVIMPRPLGKEFAKTLGHYHAVAENSAKGDTFPEVYEVLSGKAVFIMQKLVGTNDSKTASGEVEKFYAVDAVAGQRVVIPPNHGHVSVNASTSEPLVMSNVPDGAIGRGDYAPFKKMHGAAYYFNADESVEKNPAYKQAPELQRFKAADWPHNQKLSGLQGNLYAMYASNPQKFAWLLEPDKF